MVKYLTDTIERNEYITFLSMWLTRRRRCRHCRSHCNEKVKWLTVCCLHAAHATQPQHPLPRHPSFSLSPCGSWQTRRECNKNNLLLLVWLPFELFEIFILAFIVQVHSTVIAPSPSLSLSLSVSWLVSWWKAKLTPSYKVIDFN